MVFFAHGHYPDAGYVVRELTLDWTRNQHVATAHINVKTLTTRITCTDPVVFRVVDFNV